MTNPESFPQEEPGSKEELAQEIEKKLQGGEEIPVEISRGAHKKGGFKLKKKNGADGEQPDQEKEAA